MFPAVELGEHRPVTIDTSGTGKPGAPCKVTVTAPSGKKDTLLLNKTPVGQETVFTPSEVGPHKVSVEFANLEVPGSPFSVTVEKIESKTTVTGLETRK